MSMKTYEVAVIGGGPAGIAAATAAASGSASVLLIDASDAPGGSYYKPLPPGFDATKSPHDTHRLNTLRQRVAALVQHGVDVLSETRVWGVFHGSEGTISGGSTDNSTGFTLYLDPAGVVEARTLIVATGVYDRVIPFPGWTLPGVMTPGAVQLLIKKQGLLPGKRILVAGSGPLQIAVAATLAEAGADVVVLLDPAGAGDGLAQIPTSMWGQWEKLREFAGYAGSLLRHHVPIRFRHTVFRALGTPESGVRQAVFGQVDHDGHPVADTEKIVDVDVICAAYGFMPTTALTLHLGCAHDYDPRLAAYVPRHDAAMRSSVDSVLVAGDMTGAGGKALAELQGKVAGISALERLGALSPSEANSERDSLRTAIAREQRFARWIWDRWNIRPGFWDLIDDETVVCRCETVIAGDLRESCANGAQDLAGAKLRTRLGMGICQGRYCAMNAGILMAKMRGVPLPEIGQPSIRPPLTPVTLGTIASITDE